MQQVLALIILGLSLWEQCIATCPDGTSSHLPCNPQQKFVCPSGYRCFGTFPLIPQQGQCCLEHSISSFNCPKGHPLGYGNVLGLVRCNGGIPFSRPCPYPYHCTPVEWTKTRIGICCL
ncbi:hypothetical protein ACJMK2_025203 [Sinanodonta woodiana]|uniref:Uncharacterized protein n=1 Tax=Sinanodonta woodiana TaxID=1069815 RepID=A0ABD3XHB1_SINWO